MPNDLSLFDRVTVMGLGRFGGGVGITRCLARQAAQTGHPEQILVTDLCPAGELSASIAELQPFIDEGLVRLRFGEHHIGDFTSGADLVIVNPAVPHPWRNPFLEAARAKNVPITTEIRLLVERLPTRQRCIGVTGTAGKSTTAAMIHHILQGAGQNAHLGGNIGGSLLGASIGSEDWVVLELSSAMLYWLGGGAGSAVGSGPGWSPAHAVITNVTPNHLDWHDSAEHYFSSKRNIARYQCEGDSLLLGSPIDDPALRSAGGGRDCTICDESTEEVEVAFELTIPGDHNVRNARLAASACRTAAGVSVERSAALLRSFTGLPHRLHFVGRSSDDRRFYDDSKCTTPRGVVFAVDALEEASRIHLIIGGYDKGLDRRPVLDVAGKVARIYTIGAVGRALAAQMGPEAGEFCETLDRAVAAATSRMSGGDILLLSPGFASWDQFTNYIQRGERFIQLVRRLQRD